MIKNLLTFNISLSDQYQWKFRVRVPSKSGAHRLMLLLHGLTGDENSMWIFADRLPEDVVLIAPRGLFVSPHGGYGWTSQNVGTWPKLEDFRSSVSKLYELLIKNNELLIRFGVDLSLPINMVGFSQGAALMYSFALLYPNLVDSMAGLSGLLPDEIEPLLDKRPLKGHLIFIAHGTKDKLVPVERARDSVNKLRLAGAQVTYCEEDVGHKLGAGCYRGLRTFFLNK
jgi:phospholipase/carboxylesterase